MDKGKGLTIGKTRSALYETARILGDVNAVKRGTIGQRIAGRVLGALSARLIGALIRGIFGRR